MLSACGVQPDSARGGYYGSEKTPLKVELTERLFEQDTGNEVSRLQVYKIISLSKVPHIPDYLGTEK